MSRIRVLRVIARMNVGGPALQVVGLTRGLDPDEFETRLLVGSVGEGEADYLDLRAPDVEAVRVEGLGRRVHARGDVTALRSISREIRRFRPHIVHTHTAKAGVLGRVAARVHGVPHLVHTFHGHLLHGYFSRPVTTTVVGVERAMARITSRLVAVGSQVRDDLLAAGIGRKGQYVVVPPGVDLPPAPSRDDARSRLGIDQAAEVVAFVARLTTIKRPDRFVEMARVVAAARPHAVFLVVGGGELLDELRTRARDLGDRMRFPGWIPDVETAYAASDLIVLTSDNEGMPVTLIEAAMSGVPAVATCVGSVAEVVADGETGFVVSPHPQALADRVVCLLEDGPLRERMARAAAERARSLFSSERLVRDTEGLYRDLVSDGPGGRM